MSRGRVRRAELVMVGTEMLTLGARDTNSEFLKRELAALGYEVAHVSVAADDAELIAALARGALSRSDLVVVGGGLGPTGDDRTRQALARALGTRLRPDARAWGRIAAWYRARRRRPGRGARLQALVPAGAESVDNRLGSAPGVWWSRRGRVLVALPGVPAEMQAMWRREVRPRLEGARARAPSASFSIGGLPEAEVDARLADLYRRRHLDLTVLAKTGHIEVHLRGRGEPGRARPAVESAAAVVRRRLGTLIFAEGERTLEQVVGGGLRERGESVVVAESCTGGLLGARLTSVPGSSDYFLGGVTAYSDALKRRLLRVPETVLERAGAVSAACARAMAEGARRGLGGDWALAVTGVAGPGGGSARKPVGTVFIGLARRGEKAAARRLLLLGDRESVRRRAAAAALLWLCERLGGAGRPGREPRPRPRKAR